jgi:hypothetical protein
MLSYYQFNLWSFLRRNQYRLPTGISQYYLMSFEDGLWELLKQRQIPSGSYFLIPDFYCMDVVENIHNHGYKTEWYSLDENFQPDEKKFAQLLKKIQPSVVVIFHACGITSKLKHTTNWLQLISPQTIILEDSVHRLVDPEKLVFWNSQHIVMDSLRKDTPLPGSFLYGQTTGFTTMVSKVWQVPSADLRELWYRVSVWWWFGWFKFWLGLGYILRLPKIVVWAHEFWLQKHDDVIGDSKSGYAGVALFAWFHRWFDFNKVKKIKITQTAHYLETIKQKLTSVQAQKLYYSVAIPQSDWGELHVFPLGLKRPLSIQSLRWLQQQGAAIWPKFPDSPWAIDRGVLFLPLGFQVSLKEISQLVTLLNNLAEKTLT